MASIDRFSTVVGKVYEEAVTAGDWAKINGCMARQFGSTASLLAVRVSASGPRPTATQLLVSADLADEYRDLADHLIAEAWMLPRGVPLVRQNLGSRRPPGVLSRDWDLAFAHAILVATEPSGEEVVFLGLLRDAGQEPFTRGEIEAFQASASHLSRAVHLADRRLMRPGETTVDPARLLGFGVILLDGRGQILSINPVGLAILREGEGIMERGGHIVVEPDFGFDEALRGMSMAVAGASLHQRPEPLFFTIRQPFQRRRLSAMLAATPPGWRAGAEPGVMLVIADPARYAHPSADVLKQEFALTDAEVRFLRVFMETSSVRDGAAELGIALETARYHLKSIYGKTGAHSQAELTRMILRHPACILESADPLLLS